MRYSRTRDAQMPESAPLETSPWLKLPLEAPPEIIWISVGRHGQAAREDYLVPGAWCLHLYEWTGALSLAPHDGPPIVLPVRPGFVSFIPPGTPLAHHFGDTRSPARHLTAGFRLGADDPARAHLSPPVPMMQDLGDDTGSFHQLFEGAIALAAGARRRAEARLWELLWSLAERPATAPSGPTARDERVTRMRAFVEMRLSDPRLRAADVARISGASHNHALRLFQAAEGEGIASYIRRRRVAMAVRLIRHTTAPLKSVAAQVGLPDLQRFNKSVRALAGRAPRDLRRSRISRRQRSDE